MTPDLPRTPFVGPLAGWELVRLARAGAPLRGRLALGGVLALVLAGVTAVSLAAAGAGFGVLIGKENLSPDASARFGERLVIAAVLAQLLGVILLAPGYAAVAVADEKDRRTLELLLSTPLSDSEIVRDKFLARVVLLLSVALAGLPVVMAVLPFGGADPMAVVLTYWVTVGTVVLLVAVGVRAGCAATDLRGALFRAYGWTAAYVFGIGVPCLWPLSPVGVVAGVYLYHPAWQPFAYLLAGVYPLAQIAAAVAITRAAARNLRREEDLATAARWLPDKPLQWKEELREEEPFKPEEFVPAPMFVRLGPRPDDTERPLLIDDDPLVWKELYVSGRLPAIDDATARTVARVAGKAAGFVAALFMVLGALSAVDGGAAGRQMLLLGGVLAAATYATSLGVAAVGSVTRERRRKTLDALRALPVDRSAILSAKWLVGWDRGPGWGPLGLLAVGVSFLKDGALLAGLAVGLIVAGVFVVLNGGFWVGLRCPTPAVGVRRLLWLVAGFAATPIALWYAADLRGSPGPVAWVAGGAIAGTVLLARVLWLAGVRSLDRGD